MADREPNELAIAAYAMAIQPEGRKVLGHLKRLADTKTLVKDNNGTTDPMATAHAMGWRDCVRYIERMIENGRLEREPS